SPKSLGRVGFRTKSGSIMMFPEPLMNRAPVGTPPITSLYSTPTAGAGEVDPLDASNSPPLSFHRMLLLTWMKLVPLQPKSSAMAPPPVPGAEFAVKVQLSTTLEL